MIKYRVSTPESQAGVIFFSGNRAFPATLARPRWLDVFVYRTLRYVGEKARSADVPAVDPTTKVRLGAEPVFRRARGCVSHAQGGIFPENTSACPAANSSPVATQCRGSWKRLPDSARSRG
jgi:hypothetical protein